MSKFEWITLLFGILVRLAIPVGATMLFVWFLRRLDTRWQKEALHQTISVRGLTIPIAQIRCWEVHDCSPERRATCLAYLNTQIPCWEAHRHNGELQEACRGCAFRKMKMAAAPMAS